MVVHAALGHLHVLVCFFDYHDGVAGLLVPIVDHVACPDILPAGIIDSPPWQAAEGSIGAQVLDLGAAEPKWDWRTADDLRQEDQEGHQSLREKYGKG